MSIPFRVRPGKSLCQQSITASQTTFTSALVIIQMAISFIYYKHRTSVQCLYRTHKLKS